MELILGLIAAVYVYLIPGLLLGRAFFKGRYKHLYGTAFCVFSLPLLSFLAAWLLGTYISILLVLAVATAIIVASIAKLKPSRLRLPNIRTSISRRTGLVMSISLVVFIIFFMNFGGLGKGYWDTYIIVPAAFMTNTHVELTDMNGTQLYNYKLPENIPGDLIEKQSFGISTKDQRVGSAIFFSVPYLLFGSAGFRIFFALTGLFLFALGYTLSLNIFSDNRLSNTISIFSGLLLALNPYMLIVNRLNPNMIALDLTTLIICLIAEKEPQWLIIGACFGILGGIRNVALLFIPAMIFAIVFDKSLRLRKSRRMMKDILFFIIGAFILIIPILMWKQFAFGSVLAHPTQYPGLYGFRPTFEHSIFGLGFKFNGLLNYPFINQVVRTPHFPFPTYLTIPLTILSCFGLILVALMLIGLYHLYRQDRRMFLFLIVFAMPFLLFLLPQENWEDVKTTFILMVFNALIIFMTAGLLFLIKGRPRLRWRLLSLLVAVIVLAAAVHIISGMDFRKDERWYVRFPYSKSAPINITFSDMNMRDEWQYFHSDENARELTTERALQTRGNLLPGYRIPNIDLGSIKAEFRDPDHEMRFVDVWRYIY